MGHFAPGDQKGSWVAVFILLIVWWMTMVPKLWTGFLKRQNGDPDDVKVTRAHRAYAIARDGFLLLLASTALAFAGKSNVATTSTLNYLFLAVFLITILLAYVTDSRKALTSLQLIGFLLIFVNMIVAWSTASGRFLQNTPTSQDSSVA